MSNQTDNNELQTQLNNVLTNMYKNNTIVVSFDYGHSYIKAATIDYDKFDNKTGLYEIKKVSFPTVFKGTSAPSVVQEVELDYLVEYKNQYYAVGERAAYNNGVRKWNKNQSLLVDDFSILLSAALSELTSNIDSDNINIMLALGLPFDYYSNQSEKLSEMLKGLKIISKVNNKIEKTYNIKETLIMQQGVGAFYSFIIDPYGNLIKENLNWIKEKNGFVMNLIDFGYRTTDYLTIMYMAKKDKVTIYNEKSGSLNRGLIDAHKLSQKELNNVLDKTEEIIFYENIMNDCDGILNLGKQEINISKYFYDQYSEWTKQVFDELKKILDFNSSRKNLLTGGSADLIIKYCQDYIEDTHFEVQPNNFFANALGYLGKFNSKIILENI